MTKLPTVILVPPESKSKRSPAISSVERLSHVVLGRTTWNNYSGLWIISNKRVSTGKIHAFDYKLRVKEGSNI